MRFLSLFSEETENQLTQLFDIAVGIATNGLSERSGDLELKSKAEDYFKTGLRLGPGYPVTHYRYAD